MFDTLVVQWIHPFRNAQNPRDQVYKRERENVKMDVVETYLVNQGSVIEFEGMLSIKAEY